MIYATHSQLPQLLCPYCHTESYDYNDDDYTGKREKYNGKIVCEECKKEFLYITCVVVEYNSFPITLDLFKEDLLRAVKYFYNMHLSKNLTPQDMFKRIINKKKSKELQIPLELNYTDFDIKYPNNDWDNVELYLNESGIETVNKLFDKHYGKDYK